MGKDKGFPPGGGGEERGEKRLCQEKRKDAEAPNPL